VRRVTLIGLSGKGGNSPFAKVSCEGKLKSGSANLPLRAGLVLRIAAGL
jgi:hypothetical protein